MTQREFERYVMHPTLSLVIDTFRLKNNEYGVDACVLRHFYRTGEIMACSPEQALLGMLAKHLTSVLDAKEKFLPNNLYREKVVDIIIYLMLLLAMRKKENENGNAKAPRTLESQVREKHSTM